MLIENNFQNGVPIDEAFYRQHISGRHNPEIAADLFPDWTEDKRVAFYTEKEQRFRDVAGICVFGHSARSLPERTCLNETEPLSLEEV